jgi:hypothetical protein
VSVSKVNPRVVLRTAIAPISPRGMTIQPAANRLLALSLPLGLCAGAAGHGTSRWRESQDYH